MSLVDYYVCCFIVGCVVDCLVDVVKVVVICFARCIYVLFGVVFLVELVAVSVIVYDFVVVKVVLTNDDYVVFVDVYFIMYVYYRYRLIDFFFPHSSHTDLIFVIFLFFSV